MQGVLSMQATQSSYRSRSIELLVKYHHNKSIKTRNELVKLNAGLVRKIAHRISHQCSEPYEDLEQIGYLGLIRAIERFNPNQGCAFSSFAVPYIRGEILHFLRDRATSVRIPRRWQDLQKASQRAREKLTRDLGRQPRDQEVADELGICLEEWQNIKLAGKNRMPLSLDATVCYQNDSSLTLGDTLPDPHYIKQQALNDERQQVQRAMGELEEKTRAAIEFVFYNDMSRKEVAERIGVSPMTVTRRIQRGIQQMVSTLQPQVPQTEQ